MTESTVSYLGKRVDAYAFKFGRLYMAARLYIKTGTEAERRNLIKVLNEYKDDDEPALEVK